jgi:FkbM family methyltransferase
VISRFLVQLYLLVHGRLHLPGAGWLIRQCVPVVRGLHDFPLNVPDVGTARLDFRDDASFGLLNVFLGEQGDLAPLLKWLTRALTPGAVFWDVGANIGYLDLWLVRNVPALGALHAFEPNPYALRPLQSLFQHHPKVTVHPVGLGNTDEVLELQAPRSGSPIGSLVRRFDDAEHIQVPVRRGDAYITERNLPPPDVIKIDVEGFEPQVFAGLAETIGKYRPTIFFEYTFLTDEQIMRVIPPGYTLHLVLDDGHLCSDLSGRNGGHDAVLVPERKSAWLMEP